MIIYLFRSSIIIALFLSTSLWALSNTMGTPLGGMGTGYVKFNARTGDFATSGKVPPPASDGVSEFSNKKSSSCGFHFYGNGQSTTKASTNDEDAKCPLYTADFGATGGVTFTLNAFGPFIPGDTPLYTKLALSPLAYLEITATNNNSSEVDVAVAMEFANQSSGGSNLLGGSNTGANDAGMNNTAITYSGSASNGNAYMICECSNSSATYSAGSMGSFTSNGTLTNGDGNIVAAKCSIPAGENARFKFTLSWWRLFESNKDRYGSGSVDKENYFYHNHYSNSKESAEFGMTYFDEVKNAVVNMVDRVMASNFPEWYKDRLLNNLYPLIHNSQWAKDGRVAFWEGHYPIIGTIDQGEHASLWYTFNWPHNQWQELQYWARTSHPGVGEDPKYKGQIHHDFNIAPSSWIDEAHFMAPWDDWDRDDYWWVPDTRDWSDLNSMFIFKAYELMLATGNPDSMKIYFPYIKRTADRIVTVSQEAGAHLPLDSKSTYDAKGLITPQYASGTALAAYLAVAEMAKFVGQDSVATRYKNWYDIARDEFRDECFKSDFGTGREYAEGDVAGYSWARYFGFPAVMDSDFVTTGINRLWDYYSPQSDVRDKLGQWHFYTYDHFGGAAIAIGEVDMAMEVHKWDYDYYYTAKPEFVFWQDLQKTNSSYASYMTAPCVWRSYFQMTGYMLDNANNRLWIRPLIPSSMGKKITNAPLINPNGWGYLNYDENGNASTGLKQSITVSFDSMVTVKEIVLKNNTGVDTPFVSLTNNGTIIKNNNLTIVAEGSGYEKNIRVTLSSPIQIGPNGAKIEVYDRDNSPIAGHFSYSKRYNLVLNNTSISPGERIHFVVDIAGPVSLDVISINGAKIGTLMHKNISAGSHSIVWNGKTLEGHSIASTIVILRLKSKSGSISKRMYIFK